MTAASSQPPQTLAQRRMVSLRLTGEARAILARLARARGVSQAAVVEILLRDAVQRLPEQGAPDMDQGTS